MYARIRRRPLFLLLNVLLLLPAACAPTGEAPVDGTEILWDEYGVPHVFSEDGEGLFRAFGWAQMRSHASLVLTLYGHARGRAAEYWGEGHLESDRWVRTVGIPGRAEEWYAAQDSTVRRYLDAFAAGMNAYAEAHPERIGEEERRVLPVRPRDVLAHLQRAVHFTFVTDRGVLRRLEQRWEPGDVASGSGGAAATVASGRPGGGGPRIDPVPRPGSNAWAVAPARSASGDALLLSNPHLPWGDLFTWYEGQLVAPGIDAYGATLVGFPFLAIAFNDHLGWTHTVNTHDGADLYELALAGGGYLWDGEVRDFRQRRETIRVRREDGSFREETLTVRESVHGPVLAEEEGRAVALRVVGLGQPHLFRQYWEMGRARSLEAFEGALRMLQMPMFTVMYADREGHVLHLFGGRVPVRPRGEWSWSGIVPGDTSGTLWTEVHPYDDLPRVLDPGSGWLQNANDPPWTTTFPRALDPEDFPPYMAPRGMAFRPQRSARMLMNDGSVSFREMVRYKHSTRMETADRLLDDLLPLARERGSERARWAADVLAEWDRAADAGSRGGVLFRAFVIELDGRSGPVFTKEWSPEAPLETPDGLADPEAAVEALGAAAREVERRFGRLDVAWGEVYRLRRDTLDLPGNGAPGSLGVFRNVGYGRVGDSLYRATGGDSYVAAVEFGDPVRAEALVGYGNASEPGSPHRTDQLGHFARQELRPVWRTREEIRAHLAERTVLEEPDREGPRR